MPHDDLTPEEEQVRRLLADARHTEPIPADVAARLDGVLADLQKDHPDPVRSYPTVSELDAARRRRRVRSWVLAAAAVVVIGVGINQVDLSGMDGGDSGSAESSALDSGGDAAAEQAPADGAAPDQDAAARMAIRRLTSDAFGQQVEELQDRRYAEKEEVPLASEEAELGRDTEDLSSAYSVFCDPVRLGAGRLVPVRYDGERGWLVFRAPEGETQVVDLYLCGRDEPTRSITLPAS